MKIKICGITNLKDAVDACYAGADALGFVFYKPSPRYISPNDAKEIIANLPPFIQTVGLFVNETIENINEISKISNIDLAQIIDDTGFDDDTNRPKYDNLVVRYIKVVRAKTKEDILKYNHEYRLIDSFVDGFGGMGHRLNISLFDGVDCSKIILAGGLTSENVKELKGYNFYAIDVSSGVELKKGIKDKQKMVDFVSMVNELHR
jgi:phosphoribosylanthranilate isomerase